MEVSKCKPLTNNRILKELSLTGKISRSHKPDTSRIKLMTGSNLHRWDKISRLRASKREISLNKLCLFKNKSRAIMNLFKKSKRFQISLRMLTHLFKNSKGQSRLSSLRTNLSTRKIS